MASKVKHRIRISSGGYSVHHVSYLKLFSPVCSCGWEGAWVYTRETAQSHGAEHVTDPGYGLMAGMPCRID
jgi:hypothetical protein